MGFWHFSLIMLRKKSTFSFRKIWRKFPILTLTCVASPTSTTLFHSVSRPLNDGMNKPPKQEYSAQFPNHLRVSCKFVHAPLNSLTIPCSAMWMLLPFKKFLYNRTSQCRGHRDENSLRWLLKYLGYTDKQWGGAVSLEPIDVGFLCLFNISINASQ